jgi:hypothetical protein
MVGKRKPFILAIVLIPLLLGMTPLNLFNKLSGHCPFSQGKQIQRASSCLFHSIISQDDFNIPSLNSALLEKESTPSFHITAYNSTRSHISLISFPLLC